MNLSRTLKTGAVSLALAMAGLAAPAQPMMHGGPEGRHGSPPEMMEAMMRHDLREAGASEAQLQQIKAIYKQAMDDNKAAHEQLRSLREQMQAQLGAADVDANAINAIETQAQAQRNSIASRLTRARIESAKLLTPEQRAKAQAAHARRAEHRQERMSERMKDRKKGHEGRRHPAPPPPSPSAPAKP